MSKVEILSKGAIIFLPGVGASVCDGRWPTFSGPPLEYVEKFWSQVLAHGERFWSPLWRFEKILVPPRRKNSNKSNEGDVLSDGGPEFFL